jgi:hypothetical protein
MNPFIYILIGFFAFYIFIALRTNRRFKYPEIDDKNAQVKVYLPSFWRIFCLWFLLPAAAGVVGFGSRMLVELIKGNPVPQWASFANTFWGSIVALAAICLLNTGVNLDIYVLKIDKNMILCPGTGVTITRSQIDLKKTGAKPLSRNPIRIWTIWGKDGKKIAIQGWQYSFKQLKEIRQELGIPEKGA